MTLAVAAAGVTVVGIASAAALREAAVVMVSSSISSSSSGVCSGNHSVAGVLQSYSTIEACLIHGGRQRSLALCHPCQSHRATWSTLLPSMCVAIGARRQDQSPHTCAPCSRLLPRRTCAPTPSAHRPVMRAFRHLSRHLSLVFGFMCAGQCTARLPAAAWRRRQHVWLAWRYLGCLDQEHGGVWTHAGQACHTTGHTTLA